MVTGHLSSFKLNPNYHGRVFRPAMLLARKTVCLQPFVNEVGYPRLGRQVDYLLADSSKVTREPCFCFQEKPHVFSFLGASQSRPFCASNKMQSNRTRNNISRNNNKQSAVSWIHAIKGQRDRKRDRSPAGSREPQPLPQSPRLFPIALVCQ